METAVALVDCQNFYVSCERLFDPALRHRPVAVLSNNDGCVIARSEDVKEAGVEMGAPYFKTRGLLEHIGAEVFSSNYALYGEISGRVMAVLRRFAVEQEEYSIDECFLTLPRMQRPRLRELGLRMRRAVRRLVGVPVRVGIGRTKTLAKLAACRAKADLRAGLGGGVYVEPGDGDAQIAFLKGVPAAKIWGVGPAYEARLARRGIRDAFRVACLPQEWAREHLTVTGLRTVLELRGRRCLPLELAPPPRKTLTRSRSFSEAVTRPGPLGEAAAAHASRAAEKLREAGLVARGLRVFVAAKARGRGLKRRASSTGSSSTGGCFEAATNATIPLARVARRGARALYRPGERFGKAGVTLYELAPEEPEQLPLFAPRRGGREEALMAAIDRVNGEHGRDTVRLASTGLRQAWRPKQGRLSPRYTTQWDELPVAKLPPRPDGLV